MIQHARPLTYSSINIITTIEITNLRLIEAYVNFV